MKEFIFKPFGEMTEADYQMVGFKSGLEIHQQLFTDKKLFCHCPAGIYSDNYHAEILRHMRPTLSELGVYDGTALMEFKTKKEIIYRINRNTVCTYEMDDTPPFLINENALDIALGIGMLYNCKLVDELHIARKQYLDGSIPTGFQRTAIYAVDGWIPYKDRTVKIVQMSIEEDSCREVSDQFHTRTYLTDRLGMPLIETVTGPDMRTPYEVAEVGWICAKLVRSTHKVRRGIGAARQDVNVSVEGGTRVEIKGVPKIGMIPLLTHNEAMRQWNLLRLREELRKRGITTETFLAKDYDITSLIKKPHYVPLKNAVESKLKIRCIVLKGFKDLLRWQTQTDTYFSKEISDRVRVIACLTTIPNLIHSDSRTDTITSSDWLKIKKHVEATDEDTIIIVWANDEDIQTAVNEIIIRAKEATIGIPSETRQALSDGTNGFERILPGADRMYPDTDLPPKKIAEERINAIKTWLPEQFWKRKEWYRKLKIPADTIDELSISKYAELFKKAVNEWNINPVNAAVILIQYPKRLSRSSYVIDSIDEKMMSSILKAYADKRLTYDFILRAMKISSELGMFVDEIIPQPMSDDELEKEIVLAEQKMQGMEFVKEKNANSILMGILMSKLRGRISAKKVSQKVGSLQRSLKNVK
ncbi:MAG: Glu-tRNA(Gln) amidotransferase subunit GatE [Ignavibacteriota bacterium]|jgi:glutamyl-tRNA(Gln) amidotransferase subunit E|nr:Glu-tRNA(Gln) amidotransferase subunit GatE [Ignavibacteriales bacterium]MBL1123191.1 Glu-tRNA(Gln) amidotransferase GatDE subunit E [Ignavibacteriota bacterium]MEB2295725.1 Glu-tRNA(Gln) amidotransferase subunit GatE [Ignavibacteria bacterium]NUM60567.1 Glu-tRNA(Gln) amidotransferase subunit GatE [Ignavibacteriaceae bacterium]QKJ96036.1 MAG: Glu-tRNA(Gln) amidotransferase subunit GatE [Ignavibacteriota bacterium]